MKDALGHGSNPRGGVAAHQSLVSRVLGQLTKQRFTKAVPPGSMRDLAVRMGASAMVGATTGPVGLIPYLGAQGTTWDRAGQKPIRRRRR